MNPNKNSRTGRSPDAFERALQNRLRDATWERDIAAAVIAKADAGHARPWSRRPRMGAIAATLLLFAGGLLLIARNEFATDPHADAAAWTNLWTLEADESEFTERDVEDAVGEDLTILAVFDE